MDHSDLFKNLPVIETARLRMRKLSMRDASDIFEYASVPEVAENVTWEHHRNLSDSIHFLRIITQQYEDGVPSPWGIIYKETSRLIGTIGFHVWNKPNFFAEVGYAISKNYWNQGLMTEALNAVLDFGFNRLNLNRVEATCKLHNAASEKVMIKCGMSFEGIMKKKLFAKGEFHDLKLFAITKKYLSNSVNP
ncbi:MAG TPA: GNAT family protein [Ignavibacteria bacterium]|jgi:ribosomal-protein-alanine N-acetyltransferase